MSGPYRIPHVRMDVTLVVTNKTPSGTYRGPGRFEADFCRERLFDMAAADLGIDPRRVPPPQSDRAKRTCLMRWRPCRCSTSRPSATAAIIRSRSIAASPNSNGPSERSCKGKLIDGRYHGIAIGCYLEGGGTGPRENARLVIEADGSISVYVGSSSVGQGVETVFAQIAADALEVPMERINNVFHGSTDYVTEGFGSFSSRSIVMGGNAIVNAAGHTARSRSARPRRNGSAARPSEITFDRGMAVGTGPAPRST